MHAVAATPRTALRHSSAFAVQLIQDLFREYTKIDPDQVLDISDRFQHLQLDSRLEITFEGKPKRLIVPSHCLKTKMSFLN